MPPLSTLRRRPHDPPTQDSLPGGGPQPYRAGLSPAGRSKRFRLLFAASLPPNHLDRIALDFLRHGGPSLATSPPPPPGLPGATGLKSRAGCWLETPFQLATMVHLILRRSYGKPSLRRRHQRPRRGPLTPRASQSSARSVRGTEGWGRGLRSRVHALVAHDHDHEVAVPGVGLV